MRRPAPERAAAGTRDRTDQTPTRRTSESSDDRRIAFCAHTCWATRFRVMSTGGAGCKIREWMVRSRGERPGDPLHLLGHVAAVLGRDRRAGPGGAERPRRLSHGRREERAACPEWFMGECAHSMEDAIAFMALACRLPVPLAIAWACRAKIQQIRSGLMDEAVAPAPWAFAAVT